MRTFLETLCVAFSMYSTLPMPRVEWSPRNMRFAMCLFPFVGLVVGAAGFLWQQLCISFGIGALLRAFIAVLLPVAVTGGIHLDGFCDTVDARASHAPADKKLLILKDPHIGAFGVMGCVLYLLLSYSLLAQDALRPALAGVWGLSFILSRVLSGLSVVCLPCAKDSGLCAAFANGADRRKARRILVIQLLLCAAGMFAIAPLPAAACLAAAGLAFLYYRHVSLREFGGITGDLAGYFLQLCELSMVLVCIIWEGLF